VQNNKPQQPPAFAKMARRPRGKILLIGAGQLKALWVDPKTSFAARAASRFPRQKNCLAKYSRGFICAA
jgi:hypothetical protein